MSDENIVQTAVDAGQQLQRLKTHGDLDTLGPFLILPNGTVQSLEHLADQPRRVRATIALRDPESFIEYVAKFENGQALVCADEMALTFTAILDYHTTKGASWCDHRAQLKLLPTPSWQRWSALNQKRMTQEQFAEFLEDALPDVGAPAGAQILEIATTLDAKMTATFASSIRLQNGAREFLYEENVQGTAKKGTVQIPETFTLGLEPFEGAGKYELVARLRYRIEQGHLLLWFDLLRPEDVVRTAFLEIRKQIADGLADRSDMVIVAAAAPGQKS